MCARGILLSDISFDFVRSEISLASDASWPKVQAVFGELNQQAQAWLETERVAPAMRQVRMAIDARYEGQNFEVQVVMDSTEQGCDEFMRRFGEAHEREYGYTVDDRGVQIINCRLQAVGQVIKAPLAPRHVDGSLERARMGERRSYFGATAGWLESPVYDRDLLPAGTTFTGPALVEEMSSTTVIGPGQHVTVDAYGNLIILLQGGQHG